MDDREPRRVPTDRTWRAFPAALVLGFAAAVVLAVGALDLHSVDVLRQTGREPVGVAAGGRSTVARLSPAVRERGKPPSRMPATVLGRSGADLALTVFDERDPSIGNLDPALLHALRRAAADAVGVHFVVNSGWRSAAHQERLLEEAVARYGSERAAARWVATPKTSAHVSGEAVDVGPSAAAAWLSSHGSHYGLCQIYRNEPWHYELRPTAPERGCPAMYADPTQDPRMQQ